jgi:hypothetical protein
MLLVVTLSPAAGCARLQEAFTPPPKVVTEEATVAVDGASVVGELSADTPSDLPIWPHATVVESVTTDDAYSLTLTTTDSFDDVLAGVAAGFEKAGWDVASEETSEGGRVAVLTVSTTGREGFITVTELEDLSVQLDYVLAATE